MAFVSHKFFQEKERQVEKPCALIFVTFAASADHLGSSKRPVQWKQDDEVSKVCDQESSLLSPRPHPLAKASKPSLSPHSPPTHTKHPKGHLLPNPNHTHAPPLPAPRQLSSVFPLPQSDSGDRGSHSALGIPGPRLAAAPFCEGAPGASPLREPRFPRSSTKPLAASPGLGGDPGVSPGGEYLLTKAPGYPCCPDRPLPPSQPPSLRPITAPSHERARWGIPSHPRVQEKTPSPSRQPLHWLYRNLDSKIPAPHIPAPQHPRASVATLRRPPPADPGRNVSRAPGPGPCASSPGAAPPAPPPSAPTPTPAAPRAQTSQLQSAPTRPQPSPRRERRPQGGNKSVSAAPGVPRSRTPPPGPSPGPLPSCAEVSQSGRGASPGNFTNLPGSQDSGGKGSWRSELRRPATTGGELEALSPNVGPRRRGWLCLYPVPILARSRSPQHTHLHSGSAGCCTAGCRCSHFLFLPPAGQRHILHLQGIGRSAANSPPERTLRSCSRRPRHLRQDTRAEIKHVNSQPSWQEGRGLQ
ncbi:vegetative cell wall protein gp1-like [Cebus imitator]|uniref:vegetative cell wall protein gp1-like n=1 Tax=Cebus imitator TaxID=2715852 RepID=UPI00189B8882|nr:vegetative cell wall protein gp1-like [Cebus imitator]